MSRIRDIANILSGSTDMATDAEVAASYVPLSSAAANQIMYKNSSNVASGSSGLQYDGTSIKVNGNLESVYTNGDEGGEIFLNKATTNTTITNGVTVDVFQNKLRFFENGGSNRGYYLDITSGGNSAGTNLGSSGGMTLIQEVVASANPGFSLSSIPQTYKQLLLVWNGIRHSSTGSGFALRFNNNSNNVYVYTRFRGLNGGADSTKGTTAQVMDANIFGEHTTEASESSDAQGFCLIDNYSSSSKSKFWQAGASHKNNFNGNMFIYQGYGYFNSTSAITSLDVVRNAGSATMTNQNNTSIRLYGIS